MSEVFHLKKCFKECLNQKGSSIVCAGTGN